MKQITMLGIGVGLLLEGCAPLELQFTWPDPEAYPITGSLVGVFGEPLAGKPVDLHRQESSFWILYPVFDVDESVPYRTAVTDDHGRFAFSLEPADLESDNGSGVGFVIAAIDPNGWGQAAWSGVHTFGWANSSLELPELRSWADGQVTADEAADNVRFEFPRPTPGAGAVRLEIGGGDWVTEVPSGSCGIELPLAALVPERERLLWRLTTSDGTFEYRSHLQVAEKPRSLYRTVRSTRARRAEGGIARSLTDGQGTFVFPWGETDTELTEIAFTLELPEEVPLAALVLRDVRAPEGRGRLQLELSQDGEIFEPWLSLDVSGEPGTRYLLAADNLAHPCRYARVTLVGANPGQVLGLGELSALVKIQPNR